MSFIQQILFSVQKQEKPKDCNFRKNQNVPWKGNAYNETLCTKARRQPIQPPNLMQCLHPTSKNATETIRHPLDSTTDKTKRNSPNISGPLKMQTNPFKLNGK